tara:strand:- start:364 stop:525 length:162 start_codon:yes stop_codon:yes gene_type:complete
MCVAVEVLEYVPSPHEINTSVELGVTVAVKTVENLVPDKGEIFNIHSIYVKNS